MTHVSVETLICKEIFAKVEVIKTFIKMIENEENACWTEAIVRRFSTKKVFLKLWKISNENCRVESLFYYS